MIFRFNKFLYFLFFCISCNTIQKQKIIGEYESKKPSILFQIKYKYTNRAVGSRLVLNIDNSFEKKTCGNLIKGKWRVKADTLLLFYEENKFVIDSFNHIKEWKDKLKINKNKPICYKIQNNKIYCLNYVDDKVYLDYFVKTKK